MSDNNKQKAFWHATGKLIASYYNHQYYEGNATESLLIHQLGNWYGEERLPHAPFTQDSLTPAQQAAAIAYYSYGSILVATSQAEPLYTHFNGIKGSGRSDYLTVINLTIDIGIPPGTVQLVFDAIADHAKRMRGQEAFNHIWQIPTSLLYKEEDLFEFDLNTHTNRIKPFLDKHEPFYKGYDAALQLAITQALTLQPSPCVKLKR